MINDTDVIEGGASIADKIHCTISGYTNGITPINLFSGMLSTTVTTALVTASAVTCIVGFTFVNIHTSAVTITLKHDPADAGTNPIYILPKEISLGPGYSLLTDGVKCTVIDPNGATIMTGSVSDVTFAASWDGVTTIAPSKNAVYDAMIQANIVGLKTSDSPTFVTAKLSGLTDGYVPYHVADVTGLANSPIFTDGTNVGIGTAAPASPGIGAAPVLEIYGADPGIRLHDDEGGENSILTKNGILRFFVGTSEKMTMDINGSFGIGMTPGHLLDLVADDAGKPSTNTWTIVSDERLKDNIQLADLKRCYDIVKVLPLKRFTWKDDVYTAEQVKDRSKLGWISQDVRPLFPKGVSQGKFASKQQIEDGTEEYEEQDFKVETVKDETEAIEIRDGIPTLVKKVTEKEVKMMLFDGVPVVDEEGNPVLNADGTPRVHQVPRMIKKTRPIMKPAIEIEDCLDLNADQIYAAMYGALQLLITKVEKLEKKIYAS